MRPNTRPRVSRTHPVLGMCATVPIVGWILSSFVLHGVGLAFPNGLQGVYDLAPYRTTAVAVEDPQLLAQNEVRATLAMEGTDRRYWLRLEAFGSRAVYVVKPGPSDLERAYDARSGVRLDPLSDEIPKEIADEQLTGTYVADIEEGDEFSWYYALDRVPAIAVTMLGDQPSELIFSRASGRVPPSNRPDGRYQ